MENKIIIKEVELYHPFELTSQERIDRGVEAATIAENIDEKKYELTKIKKDFKDDIYSLEKQKERLLRIVKNNKEDRCIKCIKQFHIDLGLIRYVYNSEIIKEDDMTEYEKSFAIEELKKLDELKKIADESAAVEISAIQQENKEVKI